MTKTYKGKVINESDEVNKIYYIIEGSVICQRNGKITKKLSLFDHYGETYYIGEEFEMKSYYTLIAEGYVVIQEIEIAKLKERLPNNTLDLIKYNIFSKTIDKSNVIKNYMTGNNLEDIYNITHLKAYRRPEMVYYSEIPENKIVIVLTGLLISKKNEKVLSKAGEIYGDEIINLNNFIQDVIPEDECTVLEIYLEDVLKKLINGSNILGNSISEKNKFETFVDYSNVSYDDIGNISN